MNQYCRVCPLSHNGVNGRFCDRLGRYVEYEAAPPCLKVKE